MLYLHATKCKIKSSSCQKSALFLRGFQNGIRRWRDSRSIKCLNATKQPLTMKQTFPELAEMCGKSPVMQQKKTMESNRICFIKVIECLQYLARQGQVMKGDTDDESNFIQLLKLRGKDQPLLLKWLERKEDRYKSHDIQNEIIAIVANHAIRDLVSEIRDGFFSIICDEYTDISNKEQLTICIRWVDKELEAHEDFLRFYNVPDIRAQTRGSQWG